LSQLGLPLFPGSKCIARVWLERPGDKAEATADSEGDTDKDETRWVTYIFRIGLDDYLPLFHHFDAWLKKSGAPGTFTGGGRRSTLNTVIGDQKWRVTIRYRRRIDAYYDVSVLRRH
jgi:hypothetical protein